MSSFSSFTIKFDAIDRKIIPIKIRDDLRHMVLPYNYEIDFMIKLTQCLDSMIELNGKKVCNGVILSENDHTYNLEYGDIYVPSLRLAQAELEIVDKNMQYLIQEVDIEMLTSQYDKYDKELWSKLNEMIKSYASRLSSILEECYQIICLRFINYGNTFSHYLPFYQYDKIDDKVEMSKILFNTYFNEYVDLRMLLIITNYLVYRFNDKAEVDKLLDQYNCRLR